jgi:hypothetical protein
VVALVFGDFLAQGLCRTFYLLGIDSHTGQFLQEFTAFLKTNQGADGTDHARERGRQGGVLDSQMSIAGKVAVTASGTVIVGTLQPQRTEHTVELLAATSGKMRFTATTARDT